MVTMHFKSLKLVSYPGNPGSPINQRKLHTVVQGLRITSNPITCNHLLNHIFGSMAHNPLDIRHDLYS